MPSVAVICTVHIRLDETVYLLSEKDALDLIASRGPLFPEFVGSCRATGEVQFLCRSYGSVRFVLGERCICSCSQKLLPSQSRVVRRIRNICSFAEDKGEMDVEVSDVVSVNQNGVGGTLINRKK